MSTDIFFRDENRSISLDDVKAALAEHGLEVITAEEQTRTERATARAIIALEEATKQLADDSARRAALKDIREAHDCWRNTENTPDMNLMLDASICRALKGLP
jgi:hypothetical protein